MSKAEYVPAQGEQLSSVYKRKLEYNGFDMKYWSDKSHFKHNIMLQSCYYGLEGVAKGKNFRELFNIPKEVTIIGDSVAGDETIVIKKKNENNFINIKIKDFVDKILNKNKETFKTGHEFLDINNYEVLTIDNDFKVCWKKINQVIRHKVNKKLIELETIGGKRIKITCDHSLIKFKDIDNLESISGKNLNINDYIISYDKVNLNETDKEFYEFELMYYKKKEKFKLYITELELKIMGYLIGDGWVDKKHNVLSICGIQEKGLHLLWKKFAKKYKCNISYSKNGFDSGIASKKLVTAFVNLGIDGYSYTKQIPNWILNLPRKKLGAFLNGYYCADGAILLDKETNHITAISIGSVSNKLISDTKLALDKIGIKYNNGYNKKKITKINGKEYNSREAWNLSIYDRNSLLLFKKYIGFENLIKKEKLEKGIIPDNSKLQQDNLPCVIVDKYCKYRNQDFIDKKRVNHKIKDSDIGCFRIKNIREGKFNNEYVYDLSVESIERFLCSGILVHNSGGFQFASFKKRGEECNLTPIDSLRWQEENCDVGMNLDIPPNLDGSPTLEEFDKALDVSVKNFALFEKERKNYDMKLLNVLHGETKSLADRWYNKVKDFKSEGFAVGMKPPFSPMLQAFGFMYLWEKGEFEKESFKHLHFFGTSGKSVVPTLVYAASKLNKIRVTYDSSSYNIGSIFRTYYMPFDIGANLSFGEKFNRINPNLKKLPCKCPVCLSIKDINDLNTTDIFAGTLISLHNMYQYIYYNDVLNTLVHNKTMFIQYLKCINISDKTIKSIEFIDFAIEKGLDNAIVKFKHDLIEQELDKTKQVGIYNY